MATAANLQEAAGQAFDNLFLWWQANQLKVRFLAFCGQVSPTFPDSDVGGRPVGNWLVPMRAYVNPLPAVNIALVDLNALAQYVYRMCYLAFYLQAAGRITVAQANALLLAYNGNF